MSQQRHIIGRTVLELNTGDLADVWSLQEEVSRLFQQQAIPEMEQLFDRLVRTDEVVRLDQLVVEVGGVDRQFLADEFLHSLLSNLDQTLSNSLQDAVLQNQLGNPRSQQEPTAITRDRGGAEWEVMLYFLQYGRLPWWIIPGEWREWLSRWESVMQGNTSWRIPLLTLLTANSETRERLVEQFPEPFRHQLITQLQPGWAHWPTLLDQARQLLQDLGLSRNAVQHLKQQAWLLLLAEISPTSSLMESFPSEYWMRNWLRQLLQTIAAEVGDPQKTRDISQESTLQRLRTIVNLLPSPDRDLWLRATSQVFEAEWMNGPPVLSDWAVLLDFLQQGYFPSGQPSASWQDWLSRWEVVMQGDTDWRESLGRLLASSSVAQQRLVEQFPLSFRQAIDRALISTALVSTATDTPTPLADWEVLLFFLQQGYLPLGQPSRNWQDWLSRWEVVMQSEPHWQESLRRLLMTDAMVRRQLVEEFPESFRYQLILQLQPFWISWYGVLEAARQISQMLNLSNDAVRSLEMQAWLLILAELGTGTEPLPTAPWIHNWLAQLVRMAQATIESEVGETPLEIVTLEQRLRSVLDAVPLDETECWLIALEQVLRRLTNLSESSPTQEALDHRLIELPGTLPRSERSTLSPDEEAAGLYVTQAGLVVLHPFLRFYLEAVGLLEGDTFRDELAQQTAIYLMYYLATKQIDAPEYELVLPKLLCGWPLDEPVVRGVELPESARSEGEHLLQTVIDYWEVLKSTSPDGMREGFLQRQGKLTRTDDGNWKLQVEQNSIDILMSSLPWGLSMVTFPWMEGLLIVEWS